MSRRTRTAAVLVALAPAALAGGCSSGPEPLARGGITSTTEESTLLETDRDQAIRAAKAQLRAFLSALDTAMSAPTKYGEDSLRAVSDPIGSKASLFLNTLREKNLRQTGRTRLKSVKVADDRIVAKDGEVPAIVLEACLDVSGVNYVDEKRKALPKDGVNSRRYVYTLTNKEYPKRSTWKVTYLEMSNEGC